MGEGLSKTVNAMQMHGIHKNIMCLKNCPSLCMTLLKEVLFLDCFLKALGKIDHFLLGPTEYFYNSIPYFITLHFIVHPRYCIFH